MTMKARSFFADNMERETSYYVIPSMPIAEDELFPESLVEKVKPVAA